MKRPEVIAEKASNLDLAFETWHFLHMVRKQSNLKASQSDLERGKDLRSSSSSDWRSSSHSSAQTRVADPWHFGVDPDLDPRFHASD
jgi:hypothetical protein